MKKIFILLTLLLSNSVYADHIYCKASTTASGSASPHTLDNFSASHPTGFIQSNTSCNDQKTIADMAINFKYGFIATYCPKKKTLNLSTFKIRPDATYQKISETFGPLPKKNQSLSNLTSIDNLFINFYCQVVD